MNTQFFQKTLAPSANPMYSAFEKWGYGLLNASIVGGATSASSVLGIIMAKGVGLDMPPLNWKEIGIIFVSGAAVKFFAYLANGLPQLTSQVSAPPGAAAAAIEPAPAPQNTNMKNTIAIITLLLGLSLGVASAQTNTPPSDPFGLGSLGLSVEQGIQNSGLLNATNYSIDPYFTYAPHAKDKFGGGALAVFNVPALTGTNGAVGACLGGDWLGHWSMVSGNVTVKLETHPFNIGVLSFLPQSIKDITAEPFALAGVGSPLSGGSGAATIWDLGYNFKFGHWLGGRFNAGFAWGEWMNAGIESGHRYHGYIGWQWGF